MRNGIEEISIFVNEDGKSMKKRDSLPKQLDNVLFRNSALNEGLKNECTTKMLPANPNSSSSTSKEQILSPNLKNSPSLLINDDNKSFDDSSSQTSSLKARRLNDKTSQFRQRIRQQTKNMVEKKRGSVQLAKRLSRSNSLQQQQILNQSHIISSMSFQEIMNDQFALDKQIEESIKLGSKYTRRENLIIPGEHIQHFFFYGHNKLKNVYAPTHSDLNRHNESMDSMRFGFKPTTTADSNTDLTPATLNPVLEINEKIFVDVVHAKPRFASKNYLLKFAEQLTTYTKNQTANYTFEDPLYRIEPQLFAARTHRNYATLIRRVGDKFLTNSKQSVLGLQNFVINCLQKVDRSDEDENKFLLLEFQNAEDWKNVLERSKSNENVQFAQLEIDLNRIEFEHHWLFSREDAAARRLRTLFEEYSTVTDSILENIRKYLTYKQNYKTQNVANTETNEKLQPEMSFILEVIDGKKQELYKIGKLLEDSWHNLKEIRNATQYSTTNLVLQRKQQIFDDKNYENIPKEFQEIFKFPSFTLKEIVDSTEVNILSQIEMERLEAVKKCQIKVSIFYNDIHACTTPEVPLRVDAGGGFSANFNRIFKLHVSEQFDHICLKVQESFGGIGAKWYEMAQIYLPVFSDNEETYNEEIVKKNEPKNFNEIQDEEKTKSDLVIRENSSNNIMADFQPQKKAQLWGIDFASDLVKLSFKGSLGSGKEESQRQFIHGKLYCKAKWQDAELENEYKKRKQLFSFLANQQIANDYSFKLISLIPEPVSLVSEEEFQAVLERQVGQQQYNTQTCARQFSTLLRGGSGILGSGVSGSDFFAEDFGSLFSTSTAPLTPGGNGELSLDTYRRIGHAYSVLLRRHLLENCALEQRLKTYSEIVHEESLPTLFRTFGSLFSPPDLSRKLKPMRITSTIRNQQNFRNSYKLLITIQSATNLPERISNGTSQVIAEACFQKLSAQTKVVAGRHANWQETLMLDISNPKNSGSSSTQDVDFKNIIDSLEVNIYDKMITPLVYDDRELNTLHEQVKYRWMGTVRIPFSTIYSFGKVDGFITLNFPLFLSGYKISEIERHATLKLLVTIYPPINVPQISSCDDFPCGETDEKLFMRCKKWENRLRTAFPDRRFVSLANDCNGKRIFVSRFLQKISLPLNIAVRVEQNVRAAVLACVNIVSSIPFINDSITYPGVSDIWANANEMLKIGFGNIEEHAILLACWILSMNLSAYLVLGSGLPEGLRSSYVLVEFDRRDEYFSAETAWLINPTTGNCYSIDDPTIPFQVGTIITPYNAFGNISRNTTHPSQLDFNIKKRSHWEPIFTNDRINTVSVQKNTIRYVNVSEDLLTELRANLEREIKFNFDEARPNSIPQWNLLASRTLRDILNDSWIEYTQNSGKGSFSTNQFSRRQWRSAMLDIETKLDSLRNSYNIEAQAFRCAYTSKRELIEKVLKLRVHINSSVNVQHALAVHVQPFINQIISVSIAIATLLPLTTAKSANIS